MPPVVDDPSGTASWLDSLLGDTDATVEDGSVTSPGTAALADVGQRSERYVDLGLLARGGMGEVRRVHDRLLGRPAVMKIMHPHLAGQRRSRARFLAEVRITARLQHPGIVPVQEAGELPDGRLWFTMKEVAGRTLHGITDELHRAMDYGADATADGWNLRRLVAALHRVSQTMAYAHDEGVIHRDIKPDNLMVGAFGEVMVMDWGIAYDLRLPHDVHGDEPQPTGDRTGIVGTISFMAPEQALGQPPTPATDVFALGGVLFQLLTGRKPRDSSQGVAGVTGQPLRAVREVTADYLEPPPALVELCQAALAFDPARRPADAGAFGAALSGWLDGEARRARAAELIQRARALVPRRGAVLARAETLAREASDRLADVPSHAPVERKRPGWTLQAEAETLRQKARRISLSVAQTLRQALEADPGSREARQLLTEHYRGLLIDAEQRGDAQAASDAAEMLRLHDEPGNAEWLRGDGALTLVTDPPGATATLFRYVERDRRRVPQQERVLPPTPLVGEPLPRGSYVIVLQAEGRVDTVYPVDIPRGHHWHGRAPASDAPRPIRLIAQGSLGADAVHVPAGWCRLGGDPEALEPLPHGEYWVDDFVMRRQPVTHGQYIRYLDALVAEGQEETVLAALPRAENGQSLYARRADGGFAVQRAVEIDWHADMPLAWVSWQMAQAYAEWYAAQTGRAWRLPDELEWEKAARGVDGRTFPMGDHLDPAFACIIGSHVDRPAPARIDAFPNDVSPYGVRGLTGNAQTYCATPYRRFGSTETDSTTDARFRIVRGGRFVARPDACRSANRYALRVDLIRSSVGIRLVRSLDGRD